MENLDIGSIEFFSFYGLDTWARVVGCHDGDTITVIIKYKGEYIKLKLRLDGIDTCELRSKNEQVKDLSVKARNRLICLITNKSIVSLDAKLTKKDIDNIFRENCCLVWIKCSYFDKYGRVLANIFHDENESISFQDLLIQEKLAYRYGGQQKLTEQGQISLLN